MSSILHLSNQFRAALLRRERQAAVQMTRAYGVAWKRIKADLDDLLVKIAAARESGQTVSQSWLFQQERLHALQRQVQAQMERFAAAAGRIMTDEQREAIDRGLRDSAALMEGALGEVPAGFSVSFTRLPAQAFEQLVGNLGNGSPLRTLLNTLGPVARQQIQDRLLAGLASGASIQDIARSIRFAAGENLTRALVIARTEVLRSYRQATQATYQANQNVVRGWTWLSALGTRSCAACWAQHGSFHTLDETLADHPSGRCVMVPETKSWAQLGIIGIPDTRIPIESGEAVFARLSAADQRAILGDAAYRAYKQGAVKLGDFSGVRSHPEWGDSQYRRSLQEILGPDAARYHAKPVPGQPQREAA